MEAFTRGDYPTLLRFRYTNHRGETETRQLTNVRLDFGKSSFYPHLGYTHFLIGTDVGRSCAERAFPLARLLPGYEDSIGIMMAAAPRSAGWKKVRDSYLEVNPYCAACGVTKLLNVHHVVPFHIDPEKELDVTNLITLCETVSRNCHLVYGHLGRWDAYNPTVREDAAYMLKRWQDRKF